MSAKAKLSAVLVLLAAALAQFLLLRDQESFTGSRTAAPDSYALDIARMNGADRHTLTLNAGTALRIEFETQEGSLRMTLTAPDGTVLYTGSGKDATAFTVGIPESGAYTVTVEARHAKGTIRISAAG